MDWKDPQQVKERRHAYRMAHKAEIRAYNQKYRQERLSKSRLRVKQWLMNNKEKRALWRRRYRQRIKQIILDHYGCHCSCLLCNETNPYLLEVDHLTKEARQRDGRLGGERLYNKLIRLGFPVDVHILCHNCNWGQEYNDGYCPHIYSSLIR